MLVKAAKRIVPSRQEMLHFEYELVYNAAGTQWGYKYASIKYNPETTNLQIIGLKVCCLT